VGYARSLAWHQQATDLPTLKASGDELQISMVSVKFKRKLSNQRINHTCHTSLDNLGESKGLNKQTIPALQSMQFLRGKPQPKPGKIDET
jgi:hypothetical protein